MDVEQFRKAGYEAIDRICDYYQHLDNIPVKSAVTPGYLRNALPDAAPQQGESWQAIADDYQKLIMPGITAWHHPSFFAYYPCANTFEGILADLYSSSVSNPGFNWVCSPACTELESVAMDWAAKLLGLDDVFLNSSEKGGGTILTTASDSALVAVVAARSQYQRRHPEVKTEDLVVYFTTETHSLGAKAALVLGLSSRALEVTAEDNYALAGVTLQKALEEDHAKGKRPFILIATLGSTSSGAFDNLPEIFAVSRKYPDLCVHVDAAYAGVSMACPEFRELNYLNEINKYADSYCTNFHKWGLMNFDASTLWVRDRKYLTDALDVTPEFLRSKQGDDGTVIDFRNWHLALGRRFRSLKFWFVLRSYGVQGFQNHIRHSIKLNEYLNGLLKQSDLFRIVAPPSLGLTVVQLAPKQSNRTSEELNQLNRDLYTNISNRSDIFLTQTALNGVFCIRIAIGAAKTQKSHIDHVLHLLEQEAGKLLS